MDTRTHLANRPTPPQPLQYTVIHIPPQTTIHIRLPGLDQGLYNSQEEAYHLLKQGPAVPSPRTLVPAEHPDQKGGRHSCS